MIDRCSDAISCSEISMHSATLSTCIHPATAGAPSPAPRRSSGRGKSRSSDDGLTVEQQQQVDKCGWTGRVMTPTV